MAVYVKPRKKGTSITPQITNGTCHARIAPKGLAWSIYGLRTLVLILNFIFPVSINRRAATR